MQRIFLSSWSACSPKAVPLPRDLTAGGRHLLSHHTLPVPFEMPAVRLLAAPNSAALTPLLQQCPQVPAGVSLQWEHWVGLRGQVQVLCFLQLFGMECLGQFLTSAPSHSPSSFPAVTLMFFLVTLETGRTALEAEVCVGGRGMLCDLGKVPWSLVSGVCSLACLSATSWKFLGSHSLILHPAALGLE